jgi:hypothetical protein
VLSSVRNTNFNKYPDMKIPSQELKTTGEEITAGYSTEMRTDTLKRVRRKVLYLPCYLSSNLRQHSMDRHNLHFGEGKGSKHLPLQ